MGSCRQVVLLDVRQHVGLDDVALWTGARDTVRVDVVLGEEEGRGGAGLRGMDELGHCRSSSR